MWCFFDVITGRAMRRAKREARAEWCRIRFDGEAIDIEVRERPPWHDRVRWTEILAVGEEPKSLLGPGLNLFVEREPGVWASLEGDGGEALRDELRRRGVPFRPLPDLWRELDERLKGQARRLMEERFPASAWPRVESALESYRGENIGRTHVAIVRLAGGKLERLLELTAEAARSNDRIVARDIKENMSRGRQWPEPKDGSSLRNS